MLIDIMCVPAECPPGQDAARAKGSADKTVPRSTCHGRCCATQVLSTGQGSQGEARENIRGSEGGEKSGREEGIR